MSTTTIEVRGHIIDSLILAKVLDTILASGADYELADVDIGRASTDQSRALIKISHRSPAALDELLTQLAVHGANPVTVDVDAKLVRADTDGVLPAGFHSTTNLDTEVRVNGEWIEVENPEMDCALVVQADERSVRTEPMHRVRRGDLIVVGLDGVRVTPVERPRDERLFEFMNSEVSSEKPKAFLVGQVAAQIQGEKQAGGRVLVVAGPAVIHTGAGPALARLVRAGWVDLLFAGNGFATHDIESNVLGTSLGVPVTGGAPAEGGHANHLRAINEVRRLGSIAAAVQSGWLSSGVMFECVSRGVPYVLAGSLRDDGPLPDVYTDVVAAADAMRAQLEGVTVALMLATTLHAIATGNVLPARVRTYCVDINQAVVTKLADRGSHQALGIVTDVGLFIDELATALVGA